MTGKEIVQALRCCQFGEPCDRCPVVSDQNCVNVMHKCAADLIERLTAESVVLPDGQVSAIESLRKEIEWKDMVIALAQRKQVEAEAERDALREKQLWIPVTERMPELEVPVLVLDRRGNMLVRTLRRLVSDKEAVFRPDGLAPRKNITHWLPLPEAPEEGGKA